MTKLLNQQHEEAMEMFEERFPDLIVSIKEGVGLNRISLEPEEIKSFLHQLYIIAAEQRIEEIKSEIEYVENEKVNSDSLGDDSANKGHFLALSDYLSHLQEKLAAVEKELSEIKL